MGNIRKFNDTNSCDQAFFIGANGTNRSQEKPLSDEDRDVEKAFYGFGETPTPALTQLFEQRRRNQALSTSKK